MSPAPFRMGHHRRSRRPSSSVTTRSTRAGKAALPVAGLAAAVPTATLAGTLAGSSVASAARRFPRPSTSMTRPCTSLCSESCPRGAGRGRFAGTPAASQVPRCAGAGSRWRATRSDRWRELGQRSPRAQLEPLSAIGHVVVVRDAAETDKALWDRALRGDERAFVTVYDRFAQRLLTHAYRRTGSSQRAEDAVSLVMLETWRRRREVRLGSDETIAGWLFRTARYVLVNDARTARRHRQALARIPAGAACHRRLDRGLVDDERLRQALDTFAGLSSRDRDVLELAVWSGLSESEMAAALGVPVGTFKSRLSRARRRFAELCNMPHQPLAVVRLAALQSVSEAITDSRTTCPRWWMVQRLEAPTAGSGAQLKGKSW